MIVQETLRYSAYGRGRRKTRSVTGLSAVVILHIVVIYAVVTGLARKAIEIIHPPLETKMLEEQKPKDDLPPPPPPKLAPPPPPFIPPPEVLIQSQATDTANAITAVTTAKTPPAPPPSPPAPPQPDREVSARPVWAPPFQYPLRMAEEGREGSVAVECTVMPDGTTADCQTTEVKGGSSFGDAALNYVRQARYSPRVRNGAAIKEEHHRFVITFKLQNR